MTFFSLRAFIASTFFNSLGSMYGPFFSERDITYPPQRLALLTTAADNKLIRPLIVTGFLAQRRLAPGSLGTYHTDGRTAFTTTMWVAARVHGRTTYRRTPAHP